MGIDKPNEFLQEVAETAQETMYTRSHIECGLNKMQLKIDWVQNFKV